MWGPLVARSDYTCFHGCSSVVERLPAGRSFKIFRVLLWMKVSFKRKAL